MNIRKINRTALLKEQQSYYASFIAPLDDMWELGIVAKGQFYEIVNNGRIGYLVLNNDNEMVEFYISPSYQKSEINILSYCLKKLTITKAYACTFEPNYLGLCLALSRTHSLNSLLYKQHEAVEVRIPDHHIKSVIATLESLESAITYTLKDMDAPLEWLKTYYLYLLETESLILYTLDDEIIGTGEMRPSQTSQGHANIGMTVSSDYRKKGLGSYILNQMSLLAHSRGLQPICGTDIFNVASQKTIEKCGYKVYHRIFTLQF